MRHIRAAFADAPPPSDDNIVCHACEECDALLSDVRGHTPDELPDPWVERSFDQLPFFSDDAKRYYLPAFLRVAAGKPDSLVAQFILYSLSNDFRMHPTGGYSEPQKQAIRDYLAYMQPHSDKWDSDDFAKAVALWHPVP